MYKIIFFLVLLLCLSNSFTEAQELPLINTYKTKDYKAENQNWDITQCKKGFIYVANNKGLLEFNGASWQLYETPNKTITRSVKALKGKVYTGFYMDFGFWERNDFGGLEFTSIVKQSSIKMLEDEQIWTIVNSGDWIVFRSLKRVYLYNLISKKIKIITTNQQINMLTKVDDIIFFQEDKRGVFKIENGEPKLVSNHSFIKDSFIVNVFNLEGKLLFLTQKKGFFYIDDNQVAKKWELASTDIFNNKTVYSAVQLKDNGFAIGTISNGVICLNKKGGFQYQIKQKTGLSNNTVLTVFEDQDFNIWLGLDNGINSINNKSPFKTYTNKDNFLGTIYASIVYKDRLYVGTNQGLFYKKINTQKPFQLIENTQGQVWSLQIIDDVLFCGHNSGTFLIDATNATNATNIFNKQGTWQFIKVDAKTILQGSYDGLYILKNEAGKWKLRNKINGFNNSSKFVVLADTNKIFVNHEYKGVFKLTTDKDFTSIKKIQKEASIEKGIHSSIVKWQNNILYAYNKGVYVYHKSKDRFYRDSVYSKLFKENSFISAKLVNHTTNNKLWSFSKDHLKFLSPGKLSNTPEINKIYISELLSKASSGYENITRLYSDVYLIGTSNGYITINLKNYSRLPEFKVYINSVNSFVTDAPKQSRSLTKEIELPYRNNNLEFSYSTPNFNKTHTVKYQHQLEGFNKVWSVPSKSNTILFENLPFGDYTLKVRSLIGDKQSSNEAIFKFRINKPWYFSNFLLVVYIICCLFAFYIVHITSKRHYKKQKKELLERAQKESELKQLEISQQVIKLNNEKLRNDIENKNKELATSTMNMIKKNEFLNSIKAELTKGGTRSVTKVIAIIDKNLNNSDDWKMFQEAFNNADKNFLKKIKEKHAALTPNDLRLCAYLRLNLSSKEIAPLLNISTRSVEVKRYRLRKKMNLPHDVNLTSYILEL